MTPQEINELERLPEEWRSDEKGTILSVDCAAELDGFLPTIIADLRALARLREAAQPFVEAAKNIHAYAKDDESVVLDGNNCYLGTSETMMKVRDYRALAAAMEQNR